MPTYYKRDTSGTTNWNLATSWSTVSSTSAINAGTFPSSTTADPVIFDASSSSVTINVASICTGLTISNTYTGTFTRTSTLSVGSGGITLGSSMVLAGSGQLTIFASCTLVANGVLWNAPLATVNNIILTFSDNWQVTNLTIGSVTQVQLNGVGINLYVSGNYNAGIGGGYVTSGTINMILNGTGGVLGGNIAHNIEIDTVGAITQSSFAFTGTAKTYKVTAFGTYSASSCIMTIGNTPTIDLGTTLTGRVLGGISAIGGTLVANIVNDIYLGSYSMGFTQATFNTSTSAKIYVSTSLTVTNAAYNLRGTVDFVINGDCTWSGAGHVGVNLEIDAPSSNVTVTFTGLFFNSKTLKYTSALTLSAGSSNISIGTSTLDLGSSLWGNYNVVNSNTVTIIGDANFAGNMTSNLGGNQYTMNGGNLNIGGNFTAASFGFLVGTATLVFNRSTPTIISSTIDTRVNLSINKSGGASVTNVNNFSFTTGKVWNFTAGAVNMGTSTITFGTGSIINSDGMSFFNVTIPAGTVTLSSLMTVTNTLLLTGNNTIFIGTHGFTTQNLSCTAAATITLQNINANPLAEYIVNGILTLIGTLASRIILQAAGSATFNGTINPVGQLNYLSGVVPQTGMTVSQATGVSPVGLIGLLPNRPVITGGTSPTFTISPVATAVIGGSFSMRAGYKAKFTLTNNGTSTQNVAYVQTQDIDSSSGVTINSFGSNGDDINNSTIALFRTLNWGPLVASSGSVYYTFVN